MKRFHTSFSVYSLETLSDLYPSLGMDWVLSVEFRTIKPGKRRESCHRAEPPAQLVK